MTTPNDQGRGRRCFVGMEKSMQPGERDATGKFDRTDYSVVVKLIRSASRIGLHKPQTTTYINAAWQSFTGRETVEAPTPWRYASGGLG